MLQIYSQILIPVLPTMNKTKQNEQGWQSYKCTTVTTRLAALQFTTSADQLE
jgi:hypothetical protein